MAIDSRSIDTEITLELDEEDITVVEFGAAFSHFLGLVKEISKSVAPHQHQPWLIKLYPGSAGIGLYQNPGAYTTSELNIIRQTILSGITVMEHGERPKYFTDKAIEHVRGVSSVFKKRNKPSRIRIWDQNKKSRAL